MSKIRVHGIETLRRDINIEADPIDILNSLKRGVCEVPEDAYYDKDDCTVKTAEDVSYHGSPTYEYTCFRLTENRLEIMRHIEELEKLIKKEAEIERASKEKK